MNLHYLLREPNEIKDQNPVLILLHGYGSNEEDLFSFASELPETYYIISVRAPYDLQPFGHAWYAIHFDTNENKFSDDEQAKQSRDLIVTFIDEIIEKYPIDKNNVNLIGFSQGAILSYAIALSYPEKISCVIALSGYLNENILIKNFISKNNNHLQFFISHGSVDQVIPVDWARKAKPFIENLNLSVTYNEYPIGHGVAPQIFYDFKNWLIEKANLK